MLDITKIYSQSLAHKKTTAVSCGNPFCEGAVIFGENFHSFIKGCRAQAEKTFMCPSCRLLHWPDGTVVTHHNKKQKAYAKGQDSHLWKSV